MTQFENYQQFLQSKATKAAARGFDPCVPMPGAIKPFQRDIVTWACRRGRAAVFAATGLGKTLQELAWASQVSAHTGGDVLVFTPLAVAEQTVQEAAKFGVDGVSYAADEGSMTSKITVTNYDRRHKFDLSRFAGIVLDESGIIKDHASKTRIELTEACQRTPYLFCGSATPAPNDWTELGQHAEFLGVMSAKEMLAMFFVHDGAVRANEDAEEWRLKGHAQDEFWRWVASWSVMIRHPRDLGYEDAGYDLPPLTMKQITVISPSEPPPGEMFALEARTLSERIAARRNSIEARVAAAAAIVASKPGEPWLIWCNLNSEADALEKLIPGSVNVQGSDTAEFKTETLLGFCHQRPRILISKPAIAGRGLNYQHCANQVFVGLNDSFEQLFQAVRRCWRFGQTREVTAYLIASDAEGAVVANLMRKERKYEAMADAMASHMIELTRTAVRGGRVSASKYDARQGVELPAWI